MSKPALGRGLDALIPKGPASSTAASGVVEVEPGRIAPNQYQPRKSFDEHAMNELAASIKQMGVIQPLIVRRGSGGGYELIAGERRLRASKLAGLRTVPVIVKDAADASALELALIENIQREDLNPVETAEAYQRLIAEFSLTQEETARKVGKERSTVANFLRLLTLPPEVKRDLASGALSMGHAKAILSIENTAKQMNLRREILSRGLSVREAEALAGRLGAPGRLKKKEKTPSAQVAMLEDELKRALGTKVHIKPGGAGKGGKGGGRIEIEYYSPEEFERILELLRG